MDGPGYLVALRDRWRTLVVGATVGAVVAVAFVLLSSPTFQTGTRFFISTSSSDTTASAYEGNLFSQQRVTSYAEVITDQQLLSRVIDDLDLGMTVPELADEIEASVVPNTVILDVTVSDESGERAVAIAESIARQFRAMITELETPAGETVATVTVSVIADPELPDAPVSPSPARDIPVGVALGLLLGAAVIIVRARLDTRVRDVEQAAIELGTSSLGVVLQDKELQQRKVLLASSQSPVAEGLRQVCNNLDFLDVDHPPRVIVVTSSVPGEGKTTVATNLAVQLADKGRRVVLVDADARRPRASQFLGIPGGAGLTNVLNGSVDLSDVLQEVGQTGHLHVLAAGPSVPNPGNLLSSERMRQLLQTLLLDTDVVLLDSPPVLPVADTNGLAPLADGVIFCSRWGQTRRAELQQSRRTMNRVGARILGNVVTFLPRSAATGSGYGFGAALDERRHLLRRLLSRRRSSVVDQSPGAGGSAGQTAVNGRDADADVPASSEDAGTLEPTAAGPLQHPADRWQFFAEDGDPRQ